MKRGWPWTLALVVGLGLVAVAPGTLAETPPSAWDRARDPAAAERYRVHLRAREDMVQAGEGGDRGAPMRNLFLEHARAELEKNGAATSPDVRLRFDLGVVYQALGRHQEALDVLGPALAMAPRESASFEAWSEYALAAAKLDRSTEEIHGYDECLAMSLDPARTLNVRANRAEAYMRLGDLDEAVAGYREVVERVEHMVYGTVGDFETLVLARWGLAVALDRSGEPAEAEHVALKAAEFDPQEKIIGDTEMVFFVPEYERFWYFALGRIQHAKQETNPEYAVARWSIVVTTWGEYIKKADPKDRWLSLAKAHLASAQAALRVAEERWGTLSGKQPPGTDPRRRGRARGSLTPPPE